MNVKKFVSFKHNEMGGAEILQALSCGAKRRKNSRIKPYVLGLVVTANAVLWYVLLINR